MVGASGWYSFVRCRLDSHPTLAREVSENNARPLPPPPSRPAPSLAPPPLSPLFLPRFLPPRSRLCQPTSYYIMRQSDTNDGMNERTDERTNEIMEPTIKIMAPTKSTNKIVELTNDFMEPTNEIMEPFTNEIMKPTNQQNDGTNGRTNSLRAICFSGTSSRSATTSWRTWCSPRTVRWTGALCSTSSRSPSATAVSYVPD